MGQCCCKPYNCLQCLDKTVLCLPHPRSPLLAKGQPPLALSPGMACVCALEWNRMYCPGWQYTSPCWVVSLLLCSVLHNCLSAASDVTVAFSWNVEGSAPTSWNPNCQEILGIFWLPFNVPARAETSQVGGGAEFRWARHVSLGQLLTWKVCHSLWQTASILVISVLKVRDASLPPLPPPVYLCSLYVFASRRDAEHRGEDLRSQRVWGCVPVFTGREIHSQGMETRVWASTGWQFQHKAFLCHWHLTASLQRD